MRLVTLGLDFGTSSIKCVARRSSDTNKDVVIIPSPTGSMRWRSMLGRANHGPEAGRLLLFDECDDPKWRFDATFEPNLKLALLLDETSPAAVALSLRWKCCHFALPTLLLAAALREAIAQVRVRLPSEVLHICMGAPVSPSHPPEQIERFEHALHAALLLAEKWRGEVPRDAATALKEAECSWNEAVLPRLDKRTTRVVPEAFAALEGVASSRIGDLPEGRLCLVDMGGGTTDVAWINHNADGTVTPLRIDSFDIAGERIDAVLATAASGRAGTRVTRQDIWSSKLQVGIDGALLVGNNWQLGGNEVDEHVAFLLEELARMFGRSVEAIDGRGARAPETTLVLVGGATKWAPLAKLFGQAIQRFHKKLEFISVENFGVRGATQDIPLAVALGLSHGYVKLDLERWNPVLAFDRDNPPIGLGTDFASCSWCHGNKDCVKCDGKGYIAVDNGRYAAAIDPFIGFPFPVRCPHCMLDFPREEIFAHLQLQHQAFAPQPPNVIRPREVVQAQPIRIGRVKAALRGEHLNDMSPAESHIASDSRWLQLASFDAQARLEDSSRCFLRASVAWPGLDPWLVLPRVIAFASIGAQADWPPQLETAVATGFGSGEELATILHSDRPSRFCEAWECVLR